jgi:predicted nucleotidyltransferase
MKMTRSSVLSTLSAFQRAHSEEFGLVRIGVFGSIARGQFSEDSDVDVVVELAKPDLLLMIGIKQDLEALLGRSVDVVRYRKDMNPVLKQRIEQEAIYA